MSVKILGTGSFLPEKSVSNDDLSKVMDTSDEWISSRTGIRSRHISIEDTTSTMAVKAAEKALEDAGISAEELDHIFVATLSGDYATPSTACQVQKGIGAVNAVCMDINAACSGFVFGLNTAVAYARAGMGKKMMIIGVETLSKILDWSDRSTCVLFGDGAGCAIVEADEEREIFIDAGSDGARGDVLTCEERHLNNLLVKDVWFRYEKDGKDVVQDLNLEVKQGEFYALVGGNGTGKSTTLSLISRVRAPYRGKIFLNGTDIRRYTDTQLYRGYLGVLPQNPQSMFIKKTVREDLYSIIGGAKEKKSSKYTANMRKAEAIEGIVSLTRLEGLLDRHPYDLSGGEQQRLALAKVLLLQPRLLLMDEPTKGLDAEYKQELGDILKKLKAHGITIFMISHDVEFVAEYADRVGLFFQGNVVTCKSARDFFAGNSFYTTAANRMARHYFPDAVTGKEVAACLKARL